MLPIKGPSTRFIGYLIPMIFFCLLPLWVKEAYYLHIFIEIGIYSIAALGIRLVLTSGQWNFGQAGFMAIGGYTSSLLVLDLGWPPLWATLPVASLFATLVGLAVGYPALSTKGIYFAMITLCLGLVVRQGIITFPGFTGGLIGLYGVPAPTPIPFMGALGNWVVSKVPAYYTILGLLALTLVVMHRIDRSRLGIVLRSISENETLAKSAGINVVKYKLIAFVIASFFGGLAGAFSVHYHMLCHPDSFSLWDSIFMVLYVVFGGVGSIFGAVLGTAVLISATELLRFTGAFRMVIYASIMIVTILFLPKGLISLPQAVREGIAKLRGR